MAEAHEQLEQFRADGAKPPLSLGAARPRLGEVDARQLASERGAQELDEFNLREVAKRLGAVALVGLVVDVREVVLVVYVAEGGGGVRLATVRGHIPQSPRGDGERGFELGADRGFGGRRHAPERRRAHRWALHHPLPILEHKHQVYTPPTPSRDICQQMLAVVGSLLAMLQLVRSLSGISAVSMANSQLLDNSIGSGAVKLANAQSTVNFTALPIIVGHGTTLPIAVGPSSDSLLAAVLG